ncbi:MAG: hypothetical protein U5K79_18465 [Cyclobacteriaceae bacterium]|nr:hypothetical protein [Cyclobacteriaceae bacterium]
MQQIPASSIERIEIINNPSAKYDADSEGGIINIVLKKNENPGTNGAFALGAGKGDRYRLNLSALLNHQAGDWNIGGAYDNWYTTRTRNVQGDRINYDVPDQYYLTQRGMTSGLFLSKRQSYCRLCTREERPPESGIIVGFSWRR